jgi:hypothetical protein
MSSEFLKHPGYADQFDQDSILSNVDITIVQGVDVEMIFMHCWASAESRVSFRVGKGVWKQE